jgi:exo-1,4-beta-D-glucosaminidase
VSGRGAHGLSVQSRVYALSGTLLDDQTANGISVASRGVARGVLRPNVPATTAPPAPAQTYFVELLLRRDGQLIDRNVYWLSTQQDLVDWPATIGNPQATMTQYADLTQLRTLSTATLQVTAHSSFGGERSERLRARTAPDEGTVRTDVTITNTSTTPVVAFFVRADVRRGSAAGAPAPGDNQVLPIQWTDNDVTLWPGESETLHASYDRSALQGAAPVVSVSGWNVAPVDVPAGG